jgi:hypothetical protein
VLQKTLPSPSVGDMLKYPVCVDCVYFDLTRGCFRGLSPQQATRTLLCLKKKRLTKAMRLGRVGR